VVLKNITCIISSILGIKTKRKATVEKTAKLDVAITFDEKVRKYTYQKNVDQMFSGLFYDITRLDAACKARMGRIPHEDPDYKALQLLHCSSWKEIPDDIRAEMPLIISRLLQMEIEVKPVKDVYLIKNKYALKIN
jgi:hypothetical protein